MWTNEQLEHMRMVTDPLADNVVAEVMQTHSLEKFNRILRGLHRNRESLPESLPHVIHDYFRQTETLPEWADKKKIIQGEKLFILHGPEMIPMLLFASLPNSYSMAKGAHVLTITAQLTGHVHRRIFRTAQFVADVMQPGGLGANGRGIRTAQKVRLIHASIRYCIDNVPKWQAKWNPDYGKPVNQEDLASTLLDFSIGVLEGVQKTGIRFTNEEQEAYHHCWRVVGHIMGLHPDLQAETVDDAHTLAQMISHRQFGESTSGDDLTHDLLLFLEKPLPRFLKGLPAVAIRYFSGHHVADLLKIGPYNWTLTVLRSQMLLLRILHTFEEMHPDIQKYIRFLTWKLMQVIVLHEEGKAFAFDLPEELRSAWRLPARHNGSATY